MLGVGSMCWLGEVHADRDGAGAGTRYPCPSPLCLSPSRFQMPPSSAVVPTVAPKQLPLVLLSGCQVLTLGSQPFSACSDVWALDPQWLPVSAGLCPLSPLSCPPLTQNCSPPRTEMRQLPPASQSVRGPGASALPALELGLGAWVGLLGTLFCCGETRLGE